MGTGVKSGGTTCQVILSVQFRILKGGGITFSFSLTAKLPSRGPFITMKGFGFFTFMNSISVPEAEFNQGLM